MGIIIDIVLILLILGSIYLGYKKGLVKVAVSLIAFLLSIAITLVLYRPIANFIIDNTDWDEKLEQTISENLYRSTETKNINNTEQNITNNLVKDAENGIIPGAANTIAINILYGITMIGLFVVLRVVLLLINLLSDTIMSLPILKQFNETGGIIYGLLRGLLISYIILMIISLLIGVNPTGKINGIVQSSFITKRLLVIFPNFFDWTNMK